MLTVDFDRLDDIIVRARIKPGDTIFQCPACRLDDRGRHLVIFTATGEPVDPVTIGQTEIKHDRIILRAGHGIVSLCKVQCHIADETPALEAIGDQRRHPVIIFDDEKAHVFAGFQGRMIRIRHDVFYQVMTISR